MWSISCITVIYCKWSEITTNLQRTAYSFQQMYRGADGLDAVSIVLYAAEKGKWTVYDGL